MPLKKLDSRIRTLVENGVALRHRSLFLVVGDHGRDQVVILHHMMSKAVVKARPSVLWCYKKELGFSSHRKKRMKQLQKKLKSGTLDVKEDDPFELFVAATEIRYCYYSETHKILGNTYGMCVLQDFEALTPNLLARTMETVEGGGLVVLLLRNMHSLRQLCTMTMDVHSRYRTKAHQHVVARFNERFLLSLADCSHCLVLDDHLNVLPISSHLLSLQPVVPKPEDETEIGRELAALKASLADTQPVGQLVNCCKTLDQAKALLKIVEAISEQTLLPTVAMTASRGRGKSATLGLAVAAAVALGFSNVFVTSPSPENLRALFEFLFKGLDSLEYKEHEHYKVVQSSNAEFKQAVVRVNIFQQHRQTVQYIQPRDAHKLEQAELLCIDEAAAIPLPVVKKLLGPYHILMASTVDGYEGTGRSLSLKLIEDLRNQSRRGEGGGRTLTEISLDEPIRYASHDPIESWLHQLLCLDAGNVSRGLGGCPSPDDCNLYYVNRDTLFCYHKASEVFLQQLMGLYVSSHYKNSPNDLQLLSDAPAHHIFVLLGPVAADAVAIPDVLCVLQVCLEGAISRDIVRSSLSRGRRESGDLIPWTLSQQFADPNFAELSGLRVVRIATRPEYQRMGYGTRALKLLMEYYSGQMTLLLHEAGSTETEMLCAAGESAGLLHEVIAPRAVLPPLLSELSERTPETLDYIGVSFGLTADLMRFWCEKNGFVPVYLRQTANELTGEHSCIMLRTLAEGASPPWLGLYCSEFRRRYLNLLSRQFRSFPPALALMVLGVFRKSGSKSSGLDEGEPLSHDLMESLFSKIDLQLLEQYTRNMADYHTITYLLLELAKLYFTNRMNFKLLWLQKAILLGMGLQHKEIDVLPSELKKVQKNRQEEEQLPVSQLLGHLNRTMRKFAQEFGRLEETKAAASIVADTPLKPMLPLPQSLDKELSADAKELMAKQSKESAEIFQSASLSKYAVSGRDEDWTGVLGANGHSIVSVKRSSSGGGSSEVKTGGLGKRSKTKARRKSAMETISYKHPKRKSLAQEK